MTALGIKLAQMGNRDDVRIAQALGIDPAETAADSLTIAPIGEAFVVKWQGVKIVTRDELLRAIQPEQTNSTLEGRDE